jgi:hypothetical protein
MVGRYLNIMASREPEEMSLALVAGKNSPATGNQNTVSIKTVVPASNIVE